MSFEKLKIIKPILSALEAEGYKTPTPIQMESIPVILKGNDLFASAQTGTGKTAAFAIPILQTLHEEKPPKKLKAKRVIKSLILTPTRELAVQIGDNFNIYGKHTGIRNTVIYGGVSQRRQTDILRNGIDVLIATPGRLLDLINQNYVNLDHLKFLVLDEADRMLDMGFIHDIKKIIDKIPLDRQTLLFSATMPSEIMRLANSILNEPHKIEIAPEVKTVEAIKQAVYYVAGNDKKNLLIHILKNEIIPSALVFTRTKRGADKVSQFLNEANIKADSIHGDKSQRERQRTLNDFKARKTEVLVATDVAARGIDIDKLSHVFNFDIPEYSEDYIHRIGRTGRAGLSGTALSFCDAEEKYHLNEINKLIAFKIPVIYDHPYTMTEPKAKDEAISDKSKSSKRRSSVRFSSKGFSNKFSRSKKKPSGITSKKHNY